MEIKIDSMDMLKVLVNAGIDAIDAKAIIFDLLQYPDGGVVERRKLEDAKKNKARRKKEEKEEKEEEDEEEEDEEEEEEEEDEEEGADESEEVEKKVVEKKVAPKTTIARPKRISFKNFGGSVQPLGM